MGILFSIEDLVDEIVEKFETENNFVIKTELAGKEVNILCSKVDKIDSIDGGTDTNAGILKIRDGVYRLRTVDVKKSIIWHEIKHIHYDIVKKKGKLKKGLIYRFLLNTKYKNLNKYNQILSYMFYFIDQDEFESYYNDSYVELKDLTSGVESNSEKRKIIDQYLADCAIFYLYRNLNENGFDVRDYFNDSLLKDFIKDSEETIEKYLRGVKVTSPVTKKLTAYLKKLINLLKRGVLTEQEITICNRINRLVNNEIRRSYKKIYRLYSLILDES